MGPKTNILGVVNTIEMVLVFAVASNSRRTDNINMDNQENNMEIRQNLEAIANRVLVKVDRVPGGISMANAVLMICTFIDIMWMGLENQWDKYSTAAFVCLVISGVLLMIAVGLEFRLKLSIMNIDNNDQERRLRNQRRQFAVQWLVAIAILLNQGIKDRIQDSMRSVVKHIP